MAVDVKTDQSLASQLRTSWLGSVAEIADLDLQRRAWLDKANRNPHWSYIECVCSFPDDDQLEYVRREGWLSEQEFGIFRGLRRLLDSYSAPGGNNYDHVAILDDPAWHVVIAAAGETKGQLLALVRSRTEREVLLGIE